MIRQASTGPASTRPVPTWSVGDRTVRRIDETPLPPETGPWLLPEATADLVTRTPWLLPEFPDDQGVFRLASHSFAAERRASRRRASTSSC